MSAYRILEVILRYRRMQPEGCSVHGVSGCVECAQPFLGKIVERVAQEKPVRFMIMAYPCKAPNPEKVLGACADMAELVSLKFLHSLCRQVQKVYPPGARFIIAADGRAFGDIYGGGDGRVTQYVEGIKKMLVENNLDDLITIQGLDELFPEIVDPDELRAQLPEQESRDALSARAKCDEEFCYQLNGITRFMSGDLAYMRPELSKNKRQQLARDIAYQIIQRGDALRKLFAKRFPDAVRCSVHPQKTHNDKIGIGMVPSCDNWLTPWHGVAVEHEDGRFELMKRRDAEACGARLVHRNGAPSHYTMIN